MFKNKQNKKKLDKIWQEAYYGYYLGPHPLCCEAICPHHAAHQRHRDALQSGRGSLGEGTRCCGRFLLPCQGSAKRHWL